MLALRRSSSVPRPLLSPLIWPAGLGVVAYVVVAPLLGVMHELIVLGVAALIGDVAWMATTGGILKSLPLDPIYTGAMLLTLGGIEPHGLALAGPVGALLHGRWPGLFTSPDLVAPHAWASAIVAPGSTVISRWICGLAADAALITTGLLAMRQARGGRAWLAVVGAIVQAHVVVTHLFDLPPDLAEVEAAGIPFAISMLVSGDVQAGPRLAELLDSMAEPLRDVILGLMMVILAYLPVVAVIGLRSACGAARRLVGAVRRPSITPSLAPHPARRTARPVFGSIAWNASLTGPGRVAAVTLLALAVALSPLGDLADAQTHFLAVSIEPDPGLDTPTPATASTAPGNATGAGLSDTGSASVPTAAADATASPATATPVADGPSIVAVTGSGYRYQYTVNGSPQVIRGIGYNVRYRRFPQEERVRLLDRDFAALKQAGVNTVFGWDPEEFDTVLLDAAQRHGLGVAPPFDLDPDADYADPVVRAQITSQVLAWVTMNRDHPALRMWAIGNEVLHKLVYPSWMPVRSAPAWEQRARDFSSFYVELIDQVHAADPNHPIVHRDAEDAYFTWLRDAMQAGHNGQPGGHRPWLIYGVNAYTPRLAEILSSWPSHNWDVPLLVSEFAPGGMSPADRPEGFRSMWKMVRGASGWVLGGAVYAWTTDGPEEVDRVFGLVDADGQPVDGALAMVGSLYRGVARQAEPERIQPGPAQEEQIWAFASQAIAAIQDGRSAELLPATADSSIMGDVGMIAKAPCSESDIVIQRVRDPRRVAFARDNGITGEWWVSWLPPTTPNRKLTLMVQQRQDGGLGVSYIYHGPR